MPKFLTFTLIMTILTITGCGSRDAIYDVEKVRKRLESATKEDELAASDVMSKAHHQLKFEHAPDKSVPLYEEAAKLFPAPHIYFQLGDALMENGEYAVSLKAYNVADHLGYEKKYELYYNMACAASLDGDFEISEKYLEKALKAGFTDFKQISEDKRLSFMNEFSSVSELILKYKKALSPDELAMIGVWHAAPHVSAGFNELLQFFPDRRFVFHKSDYDALERETSVKGTYEIKDGILTLTLNKVIMLEGGEIVDSVISGDEEIEGGKLVEKNIDPPRIIKKPISKVTRDEDLNGKWRVTIGGKTFWQLSQRPEQY